MQYPVMLNLEGKNVLVVGCGKVGTTKARSLALSGARLTIVDPTPHSDAASISGNVSFLRRNFLPSDLENHWLVFAATGDEELQQWIYEQCTKTNIWVNCADEPMRCSFTLPSVRRIDQVTISVSTSGASPALSRYFADKIAASFPPNLGEIVEKIKALRQEMKRTQGTSEGADWTNIIESVLAEPPKVVRVKE